ncbi:neuronal acetylcholine receptor subunit alpha-2-like [Periplaneta americana]|uniref:neuronal acetylcholine receptor subunit alpha-2-like n=1 Tax=Periplaneta americana TaxID=6978 RepID=UPI0037E90F9C
MIKLWTPLLIYFLLVLFGTQPSVQQYRYQRNDPKCDKDMPGTITVSRLRRKLFCFGYDVNRPAYNGNETVDVSLNLQVLRFNFDEKTDSLEIHSILIERWRDFRLKWNPADFDNIDKLLVINYYLWRPDLGDFNAADMGRMSVYGVPNMCILQPDGIVICVPVTTYTTSCSADLTLWPYDSHTCNLAVGSWSHEEDKINISAAILSFPSDANLNREWQVTSTSSSVVSQKIPSFPDVYSTAVFTFVLKRHPKSFAATVILPAVVLMLVTLVTYWMEASESERLILAAVDVVCHFTFLMHLGRVLPSNGEKAPLIVTFYRDSMFLATMAVFTAAIVRGLKTVSVVLPIWASALSRWLVQTRVGQVLIFHNSNQKDDKTDVLEIHSWLRVGWHDFRLKWDAANYDNIDRMRVISYYVWKPDVGDYTAADMGNVITLIRPALCMVYSDGFVICVPPYIHTITCSADLTLWPYDSHTCRLEIGILFHEEDKIRITEVDLYLNNPNVNREWQVTSTSSSIESKEVPSFEDVYSSGVYTFVLRRQPRSFAATVILPAVVLMLVTLATYWMEASESERLILAAVDVLCHFGFLMHLGRVLPSNGDKTPLIVTFYRDSMFLATMAVFTTVIVRGLKTASVVLPIWASALSRWVVQTRVGQVLIFHNSNQNVNTSTSGNEGTAVDNATNASLPDWDAFLLVFNFLTFVVTLFTYFVLLVGFIP